ncbi:MAG: hypothetical protein ABIB97_01870 [Patescibacteria group bacterium]
MSEEEINPTYLKRDLIFTLILSLVVVMIFAGLVLMESSTGQISQVAHKLMNYLI